MSQVEELKSSIAFRLTDLEQHTEDGTSALKDTIEATFQKDDKILNSLQKLGWELDHADSQEPQVVDKLREICMR